MFWIIIKKELHDNLLNKRFIYLLILSVVIGWSSTYVLSFQFNEQNKNYYNQVNLQNKMLDNYFNMNAWDGAMAMPPQPPPVLSSIVKSVRNIFSFFVTIDNDPILVLFPFMDIVFIIGIIMSVVTLSLAYDSISGEKESGLLKLILTNSISRNKVLLGKWFGGFLSVVIILFITLIGAILISFAMSQTIWALTEWITLIALTVLSILYCASFYSIGVFISTKTKNASDSIILSLLFWVLFTLVIPTIPKYVAEIVYPTPSASKIQYEIFYTLNWEVTNSIKKIREPYLNKGLSEEEITEITKSLVEKIIFDYTVKSDELKKSVTRNSKTYETITALLHFFSPYSSFIIGSTELTATGALNQINFGNSASSYSSELYRYIQQKSGEEKLKNTGFTRTTRLDIRNRPQFQYNELSVSSRLLTASIHTSFIFIYIILFFVFGWKSFLKYDVR